MKTVQTFQVDPAKPGATAAPETGSSVTGTGETPSSGGSDTIAIVTVTALDPTVPSITITTADGKVGSHKVKDATNVPGSKAGEKVHITYENSALIVSVN